MAKPENVKQDSDYLEEEDYKKEQKISIKQIILLHIKRISDLSINEFKEGYTDSKPISLSTGIVMSETWHPDTRLSYINAIDFLLDMVRPYIGNDPFKDMLKKLEEKAIEEGKKQEQEKANEDEWIIFLLKLKRKLFSEIILMLARTNFWETSDGVEE